MSYINDNIVLITGSSRGIGLSVAKIFAEKKYKVFMNCNKSSEQLNSEVEKMKRINPNIWGYQADVSIYSEATGLFGFVEETAGEIDILINNAGISYVGMFQDMSQNEIKRIIDVNLYSMLNCCHLAIPSMIRKKRGCIVSISSIWGSAGASCEAVYSASKGAVNSFTKSLAKELGPSGIRVNAVSCGMIDTEMNSWLDKDEKQNIVDQIPLCRMGSAGEIANLVFFIASPESSYVTGQIITADGGYL